MALYGPEGSGQVRAEQITSYSFDDLAAFLAAGPEPIVYNAVPITPTLAPDLPEVELTPEEGTAVPFPTATPPPGYLVQESLTTADWIIFAQLADDEPAQALSNFLVQRPDLARNRRLIVFAYNAPYFLTPPKSPNSPPIMLSTTKRSPPLMLPCVRSFRNYPCGVLLR